MIPKAGDQIEFAGFSFTVLEVEDNRRITSLIASPKQLLLISSFSMEGELESNELLVQVDNRSSKSFYSPAEKKEKKDENVRSEKSSTGINDLDMINKNMVHINNNEALSEENPINGTSFAMRDLEDHMWKEGKREEEEEEKQRIMIKEIEQGSVEITTEAEIINKVGGKEEIDSFIIPANSKTEGLGLEGEEDSSNVMVFRDGEWFQQSSE
jgi:hypothetical protein